MLTANDPNRKSWLETPENTDFPIQNIPFGVFMADDDTVSIGTRIGDTAIDLSALQQLGYLNGLELPNDVFLQDTLNDFITLGRPTWRAVRNRIAELFDADNEELRENQEHQGDILFDAHEVQMLMPVFIQDYT
ncbi:MAG TPA: fumarylacetoacetase, partial [Cryomorphaceae bacterium]|nr:fumarylacetoacetase [Cryomorphaceae bacterium]